MSKGEVNQAEKSVLGMPVSRLLFTCWTSGASMKNALGSLLDDPMAIGLDGDCFCEVAVVFIAANAM